MADSKVTLAWTGEGLQFEAPHPSHVFRTDGDSVTSYSPVQTLLLALLGCMAADVVDITSKMRVPMSGLEVVAEGERNAEPPRFFTRIHLRFVVRGVAAEDREKIERAIALSHEKYCSVYHTLRKDLDFSTELQLA